MARKIKDDQNINDYVDNIVKKAGTSFYWGMRFLPKNRRNAMFTVYAFCRVVDDIADGELNLDEKKRQLDEWKKIINGLYQNNVPANNKIASALKRVIDEFSLPKDEFLEIIAGMEMDMNNIGKPLTMSELKLYCRRVAGAVGMLSIHIFGDTSKETVQYAICLGEALQLTNILRDEAEDADMGRIYIPWELMNKYGVAELSPKELLSSPALLDIRKDLADMTTKMYAKAQSFITPRNKKALKEAEMMMRVYRAIFNKMQKRDIGVVSPRVKLGKLEMLKVIFYEK